MISSRYTVKRRSGDLHRTAEKLVTFSAEEIQSGEAGNKISEK